MIEPGSETEQASSVSTRKETSFVGDVSKLVSGTVIAQALGLLAAPIYTRMYAPEAFGVAALFASVVAILGVFATMRYEQAIMLPASNEEAASLLGVSIGISVLVSISIVPLLILFGGTFLDLLNAPELRPYFWLMPVAVFISGSAISLTYWNARKKNFGRLSFSRVAGALVTVGSTVGAGYAGYGTGSSMIVARWMGQAVSTGILSGQILRKDRRYFRKVIQLSVMWHGIKRYRKFPLYTTWATLLNTASWQLPVLLLSSFFSTDVVGFYSFGFRLIQFPMSMIGRSISQVFFQRASDARIDGTLTALVEATFRRLVMFGMFPLLLLTFIGKDLFEVIFGANWVEAGTYVQILAPWAFIWFISSPLSILSSVLEKQEFGLFINVMIFVSRLISLLIGGVLGNVQLALILFSISGILVYGYLVIWLMALVNIYWKEILRIMAPYFLVSVLAGLSLFFVSIFNPSAWINLLFALILGVVYFGGLAIFVPEIKELFSASVIKVKGGA